MPIQFDASSLHQSRSCSCVTMPCRLRNARDQCHRLALSSILCMRKFAITLPHRMTRLHVIPRSRILPVLSYRSTFRWLPSSHPYGISRRPTGVCGSWETEAPGSPLAPVLTSRTAISGMCIMSTDLLSFIDPLPMDRLALHNYSIARYWPAEDKHQLLAVAHRDLHVARRNVADLTRCLDDQAVQLAVYAGAGEDTIPLMTMETFPRLTGGVRAVLDDTLH